MGEAGEVLRVYDILDAVELGDLVIADAGGKLLLEEGQKVIVREGRERIWLLRDVPERLYATEGIHC